MTTVLGIAVNFHDSSVALVKDGELCEVVEVERISRVKKMRSTALMSYALDLLARHELDLRHLDAIATSLNGGLPVDVEWTFPRLYERPLIRGGAIAAEGAARVGQTVLRAVAVHHHAAHAALAAYASPFSDATVLSYDGGGDEDSCVLFTFERERLHLARSYRTNLGALFSLSGEMLFGLERKTAAGKLMAYAAFGTPRQTFISALLRILEREESPYERSDLWDVLTHELRAPKDAFRLDSVDARDFAASIQFVFEEELMRILADVPSSASLCLTGGCALNCVANTRVAASRGAVPYVTPMADDGGIAAGAALLAAVFIAGERPRCDTLPFLGRTAQSQIAEAAPVGMKSAYLGESWAEVVAEKIATGGVYALLDGRSECGPRALGHRSLLADPRRQKMVAFLNSAVKGREWYRPFAPAVLAERAHELFEGCVNEYMSFSAQVRFPEALPAITHVDGSTRAQAVSVGRSPALAAILAAFEQRTGVPALINTSLNGPNEPICDDLTHALTLLADRPVDGVVSDGWLIERR